MSFFNRSWPAGLIVLLVMGAIMLSSQQIPETPISANLHGSYPTPQRLTFAGEEVPLHIPDVAERLDREINSNAYFRSNTIQALKRLTRFLPQIEAILQENDMPADLKYVALAESLFGNVTSPAGAAGFWQLMPDFAKGAKIIINDEIDERFHLPKATVAATKYFKTAHKKFGSWTNAAASYNRGMGGLERALKTQKVDSYYDLYLNEETWKYVFRILALKAVLEDPEKYGYNLNQIQGYQPLPVRSVTIEETIPDLPQFALDQGTNYKTLKLYNPWIKGYKLTVSPAIPQYTLLLPSK